MNRKDYDSLIDAARFDIEGCDDAAALAEHIVNTVLKKACVDIPAPPISEQIWVDNVVMPEGYDIYYNGKNIAWVKTDVMRDVILQIPALLKVCEGINSDCDAPDSDGDCFIDGDLILALRKVLNDINAERQIVV